MVGIIEAVATLADLRAATVLAFITVPAPIAGPAFIAVIEVLSRPEQFLADTAEAMAAATKPFRFCVIKSEALYCYFDAFSSRKPHPFRLKTLQACRPSGGGAARCALRFPSGRCMIHGTGLRSRRSVFHP